MLNQKKLLKSDIIEECGQTYYDRGKQYQRLGMVSHVKVMGEGALFTQLNASVNGTEIAPYKQNIRITWRPDYRSADIEGSCSCPVGYNCKHVAAVCIAYQNETSRKNQQTRMPVCNGWMIYKWHRRHSKPIVPKNLWFIS